MYRETPDTRAKYLFRLSKPIVFFAVLVAVAVLLAKLPATTQLRQGL